MARKKSPAIVDRLGQTVSDMANAASVAATGSELGVLELAAEDEINPRSVRKPVRKTKATAKRSAAAPRKIAKTSTRNARNTKKKPRTAQRRAS